jgi:hypothetical protein
MFVDSLDQHIGGAYKMKKRFQVTILTLSYVFCLVISFGQLSLAEQVIKVEQPLVVNGGFEMGFTGWKTIWSRDAEGGKLFLDDKIYHSGQYSARIEHTGMRDWSFGPNIKIPVTAGEIFEVSSWVKISGDGEGVLCATTYDSQGKVCDWSYGAKTTERTDSWQYVDSKFRIPGNVVTLEPRWIGNGQATIWLDDFAVIKRTDIQSRNLPAEFKIENSSLRVTLETQTVTLTVLDKKADRIWGQQNLSNDFIITAVQARHDELQWVLFSVSQGLSYQVNLMLDKQQPEFTMAISGDGKLVQSLQFPQPFVTDSGTYLVVPMNEGISYPVDDETIPPMRLVAYGGHGICMSFWGVTNGDYGQMAIIETPDDASIRIDRSAGKLYVAPVWEPQKGLFGYSRKIRYIFTRRGGFVSMCKRYRDYVKQQGTFKTLLQKRKENPNVDLLIGAANIWCWEKNALSYVQEMQVVGIKKILWSAAESPQVIEQMNDLGVLTSRYDIYQDVMNPDNFQYLSGIHPDWPTAAWPRDIVLDSGGQWLKGWQVKGKEGEWYPCGVLCDSMALNYAAERIPAELKTYPYRCRFIDTTTASPWRECYSPDHPMTRSQSREWKMKLLQYVSRDMNLVTGSETGHDAAVPYLHYFEGMMSLGPYRITDAGRNMSEIIDEVPEQIAKFQLGYQYRLPLWELVYHDCVVSYWYWGDYNNKIPAVWQQRDLFNILYGTPPMFMFNKHVWEQNRDRFIQSYHHIAPVTLKTGYSEMTNFRFLTADRSVQQAWYANGASVIVNFGSVAFRQADGTEIKPFSYALKNINH